jgi:hypothetical protein
VLASVLKEMAESDGAAGRLFYHRSFNATSQQRIAGSSYDASKRSRRGAHPAKRFDPYASQADAKHQSPKAGKAPKRQHADSDLGDEVAITSACPVPSGCARLLASCRPLWLHALLHFGARVLFAGCAVTDAGITVDSDVPHAPGWRLHYKRAPRRSAP